MCIRDRHYFDRARAAGHNAGTHIAEICVFKVRVLQHGNEHGRNTVEAVSYTHLDVYKRQV